MNIKYEDIHVFKRYDLAEIIRSYGHQLKKQGEGYITNCPFHDDKIPSLSINLKGDKWLWHCFGCRASGTVIDFVMKYENLSLQETYKKLKEMNPGSVKVSECQSGKVSEGLNRLELLKKVTDFYLKSFYEDGRGLEYLKGRGIEGDEIYRAFKTGYVNGSLKKTLPLRGSMVHHLKELGILNEKGNETFYNCVVIPLLDEDGNIVSLYGRNIGRDSHLYIKGPHEGLVNRQGAYGVEEVILTESIIDAMSLYSMGVRNVIPCYGTGGFTEDHADLLRNKGIRKVLLAYDNDEAGEKGSGFLMRELAGIGVEEIERIILPEGIKDVNDLLVSGRAKEFESLSKEVLKEALYDVRQDGDKIHIRRGEVEYRVRLGESVYIRHMKVNIKLTVGEVYHIDVVDLYSERSRSSYIKRITKKFHLSSEEVERDLYKILEEVDKLANKETDEGDSKLKKHEMTEEQRQEALKELKGKDLVRGITKDLERAGCMGEEMNKLLGYIVTVSRKLDEPLSMIIVSQSGAGKSNLADILESITPDEECVHLSRITPQALYYMDKGALKRKVLVIEEKEGSESADYSIRVLQSKKILRLAVPIKDPQTGRMKTEVSEVEGQVTVIETTTKTDLNPENTSRCFIVYLDESEEQTKRIHEYQKAKKTIKGANDKGEVERIITKHQNMQRLLEPVTVHNPYVEHISFPTKWLRVRRDHMKFLNLIEAVTFLHQHQRERKLSSDGIEYIESTIEDYRVAYEIAKDVIGDCLTELMKPEREFYERLEKMAEDKDLKKFSRRKIREYTGLQDHVVRKLLNTLVELEYILVTDGKNGVRYEYMINPYQREAKEIIEGLTTPEELEKKLSSYVTLRGPCENLAEGLTLCKQIS